MQAAKRAFPRKNLCVPRGNAFAFCAMPKNTQPRELPNLILTGFMGTGKSSVGRLLARAWRRPFFDTDLEIEKRAGKKIRKIFEEDGEAAFRELERRCADEWMPEAGAVIATGGGILSSPGMREKLRSRGVVVTLFASPETIFARTRGNARPLLNAEDPTARIRELLAAREREYMRAGIGVYTDERSMHEIAQRISRIYAREIRSRERAVEPSRERAR